MDLKYDENKINKLYHQYMNQISQISQTPPTFVLSMPHEPWYQQEFTVSLIGVLLGFLLGFLAPLVKEYIQNKIKIKKIAKNLVNEIGVNYTKSTIAITEIGDIKNRFISLTSTTPQGSRSHTPRLEYTGVENRIYYDLYFNNLDLLDYEIQRRVTHFYSILRGVDAQSKNVATMFKDYYAGNTAVKSGDIIDMLSKIIEKYKATEVLGVETIALMFNTYKHLRTEDESNSEQFTVKIKKYIQNKKLDKTFTLREIAQSTNIDLLTCACLLQKLDNIKNSRMFGIYSKII